MICWKFENTVQNQNQYQRFHNSPSMSGVICDTCTNTVKSRFKNDLNLQIHQHRIFFFGLPFLDSVHKSFLNQNMFGFMKGKIGSFLNQNMVGFMKGKIGVFLNQDLPVLHCKACH